MFVSLFELLKPFCGGAANIDHFFATLLYLGLHTPMIDLGTRLQKDSKSTVSRIFHSWIDMMYHNLRPLVSWPDAETLRKNLTNAFKKHFSNVKCIIDCFENFTERPVAFYARASTYSNYKKHNTLKVLIGIAPTGAITFCPRVLLFRFLFSVYIILFKTIRESGLNKIKGMQQKNNTCIIIHTAIGCTMQIDQETDLHSLQNQSPAGTVSSPTHW